jgi:effector-binding domain-containing protein
MTPALTLPDYLRSFTGEDPGQRVQTFTRRSGTVVAVIHSASYRERQAALAWLVIGATQATPGVGV